MKPPLVLMIILKQHTHSVSTYFSKALYPPPPLGQSLSIPLNINPTYLLISHLKNISIKKQKNVYFLQTYDILHLQAPNQY